MPDPFIEFGERFDVQDSEALTIDLARRTCLVMRTHRDFELVELRHLTDVDSYSEILVVDCKNDGVPSRNPVGIFYRERLGLRFFRNGDKMPEVRALRRNFPLTSHQNHVPHGEPVSLCFYFGPWSMVERSWTPQKHLAQVLWWLAETANGSLHRPDQPVEPIYFRSPYELVLPLEFDAKVADKGLSLIVNPRPWRPNDFRILIGSFVPPAEAARSVLPLSCVALSLPPIVHGRIVVLCY